MTSLDTGLPSFTFSTDELPSTERFDAWRDVISPVFDLELLDRRAPRACRAGVHVVHLGQLLVSRISLAGAGQRGVRAARKIRRDSLDHYVVEVYTGGGCAGEVASGAFDLAAGGVGILDLGQPLAVESTLSESVAVTIPRALLDKRLPDAARLHGTVLRGAAASLLGDYIWSLYRHLPHLSASEAAQLSTSTLSMIVACLTPSSVRLAQAQGPVDSVLLERAQRFIGRNLESPDLSVARICAALRVSRSHLYRAFEGLGGVAAYVQSCRLSSARAALLDPADIRPVSALAYDHGFVSAAHFSRAFRHHFGITPSDAREQGRAEVIHGGAAATSHGTAIESWLRELGPADR